MREYKYKNKRLCKYNKAENWFREKLIALKIKTNNRVDKISFKRQIRFGMRIFDFWCFHLGIVVEIDGTSHDTPEKKEKDQRYDKWLYECYGIEVYRIRTFDEKKAQDILNIIENSETWKERRECMEIKSRKRLVYEPSGTEIVSLDEENMIDKKDRQRMNIYDRKRRYK